MRTTGGKGFVHPTWWGDSQNGYKNFKVRENDSWDREKTSQGTDSIADYVIGESVRTSKVEQLRRITEETRNFYILETGKL